MSYLYKPHGGYRVVSYDRYLMDSYYDETLYIEKQVAELLSKHGVSIVNKRVNVIAEKIKDDEKRIRGLENKLAVMNEELQRTLEENKRLAAVNEETQKVLGDTIEAQQCKLDTIAKLVD